MASAAHSPAALPILTIIRWLEAASQVLIASATLVFKVSFLVTVLNAPFSAIPAQVLVPLNVLLVLLVPQALLVPIIAPYMLIMSTGPHQCP